MAAEERPTAVAEAVEAGAAAAAAAAEGEEEEAAGPGDVEAWRELVLDLSAPLAQRTEAAFCLRTEGSEDAVAALSEALRNREDSALMRHELAYILGQMQRASAVPLLEDVLRDRHDDCMVRHECAEALGAIGAPESLPVLEEFVADNAPEVAETCRLAVSLLRWRTVQNQQQQQQQQQTDAKGPYLSVDPAPPAADAAEQTTGALRATLMDREEDLFERYRAMFALRDRGGEECVLALCDALDADEDSALFRHELAYVLGQMQHPAALATLRRSLANTSEHRMVRHEAAEALGALIGGDQDLVQQTLHEFRGDDVPVVSESCEVALGINGSNCLDGSMARQQPGMVVLTEEGKTPEIRTAQIHNK